MKFLAHLSVPLLLLVSATSVAQDCEGPSVKFGTVMSGFQAGFTAGGLVLDDEISGDPMPQPAGLYLASSGIDTRGFIDAETGSGFLCDGDWGLISFWLGISIRPDRPTRDAKAFTNAWVLDARMIVTNTESHETILLYPSETKAKLGVLPVPFPQGDSAIKTFGVFLEPGMLDPGTYEVETLFSLDSDCFPDDGVAWGELCDGIGDVDSGLQIVLFEVLPN